MENASKALIIAGAILLSIAIIGIGMSVFNGAQDAVNQANMDEATITTFNAKFSSYEGKNKKGSDVNNLLKAIKQNNLANQDDESKIVEVEIKENPTATHNLDRTNTSNNIYGVKEGTDRKLPSGYTYEVTFTPSKAGLYTYVYIKKIN